MQTGRPDRQRNLKLIELRLNAGLAPSDLAYRAGTSAKHIRLIESGFVPSPRVQFAIAAVFGLMPLDLWPLESQLRHADTKSKRLRDAWKRRQVA